jgi:hypothetical protein
VDPQRGAALAGAAEVQLDGVRVVGDGAGDALGQAALGLEPLPAVQDLLAGVDPQVAVGEPGDPVWRGDGTPAGSGGRLTR